MRALICRWGRPNQRPEKALVIQTRLVYDLKPKAAVEGQVVALDGLDIAWHALVVGAIQYRLDNGPAKPLPLRVGIYRQSQ